MSETATPPQATFAVVMGAGDPQIRVQIGERSIPIDIQPAQAAEFGMALLAASALCSPNHPRPPQGETIQSTYMPVIDWQAGNLEAARLPVLVATVLGSARIFLRFSIEQAAACGEGLKAIADSLRVPSSE